ncbi:MAG: flagellar hook-associated protein FlgL, partial [Atribacterota bacterium]|nr:flagellar hook-associated protein FlgL [Atribacterota bacterium]
TLADSSLEKVVDVLQKIRVLAIQGANGTLTAEDRLAVATQVEEILKELVGVANSSSGDKYLFAGTQTLTMPFTLRDGQIAYWGDGASVLRAVDHSTILAVGVGGDEIFFRGFEVWSINPVNLHQGDIFSINGVNVEIDASIGNLEDLVNRINNDPNLRSTVYAFSDGSRLFLRSRTSSPLELADVSGTPLGDWGMTNAGGILKVVQDLIGNLRANNPQMVSAEDIAKLDQAINDVSRVRADVGAKVNRLENALRRFDDFALSFRDLLSRNEDIDLAEVVMLLQEYRSVYETALAAAAQVMQPTLLQFLR